MRLRVFIIEPYEALRDSLAEFVTMLGHEAVAVVEPHTCPHYAADGQQCFRQKPCADAVILGQMLPGLRGLELVERRIQGGCKGSVANVAMICAPWSERDSQRAKELGFRVFETPLRLEKLAIWLHEVAATTPLDRKLPPLPATETPFSAGRDC